jgi:hypothetical protein
VYDAVRRRRVAVSGMSEVGRVCINSPAGSVEPAEGVSIESFYIGLVALRENSLEESWQRGENIDITGWTDPIYRRLREK